MNIIHLSDIHFGNPSSTFRSSLMSKELAVFINDTGDDDVVFVISGDITFKGRQEGYQEAKSFFDYLLSNSRLKNKNVIACPGNHDITESGFHEFDKLLYGIRKDSKMNFSEQKVKIIEFSEIVFFVVNTSYHLDSKFGLVDTDVFNENMKDKFHGKTRVAVFHHHLLNVFDKDISAIRNAYSFVKWLEKNDILYAFHGHQHVDQEYSLGSNCMKTYSARSGNFTERGYMNAFNYYSLLNGVINREAYVFENLVAGQTMTIRKIAE